MSQKVVIDLLDSSDEETPIETSKEYNTPSQAFIEEMDEDEQLKLALELSLSQSQPYNVKSPHINEPEERQIFYQNKVAYSDAPVSRTISFISLLYRTKDNARELATSALFSSFSVDFQWLKRIIPPNLPHSVVRHYRKESEKAGHYQIHENLTVIHPKMSYQSFGSMHCKIHFILFSDAIRIAISSANLVEEEWTKLDQLVWYEDFKMCTEPIQCEFRDTLIDLVSRFGVSGTFLNKYDFSTTKAIIVVSLPGVYNEDTLDLYGHLKLRKIMRDLECNTTTTELIYQASSLGNMVGVWIREFVESCCGKSDNSVPSKSSGIHFVTDKQAKISVSFPSQQAVISSKNHEGCGLLFLKKKGYQNNSFCKKILREWVPTAPERGVLPHYKMLCALDNNKNVNWVYIGSHNFSVSAWGRVAKGTPTFSINNFEVGVILPGDVYPVTTESLPFSVNSPFYKDSNTEPYFID